MQVTCNPKHKYLTDNDLNKTITEKFLQIKMTFYQKTDTDREVYFQTTFSKSGLLRTLILTLNFINNQSACRTLTKEREIYA